MIGFFDYTTILTYASLASAVLGIVVSLSGAGHPFIGSFFLLFCGLCDAFDGKVARTKSNRTEQEKNYGIQIDRYAIVNFETFKEIVDIMGGVDVELTQEEIWYINDQIAQNGQTEYLPYDTQPGMVHLNGQQSLWYARNRGGYVNGTEYGGSDWDRVERQRNFLNSVMDELKNASLAEIVQIVNAVGPSITTNLKNSEITSLVASSLTYLSYDIEQLSMPTEGTWSYGYNEAGSVILVNDWNRARYDLAKFIYEDSVADTYSY